jgi:hypothetical protein
MKEIVWKNPWSDRFLFLEKHIPTNVSIVDFGCGNKQILDYCSPSEYLGIDLVDEADLKLDLNSNFELDKNFELGLILGLLEHVDNPEFTLKNCIRYSDKFLILTSSAKMKKEWKNSFNKDSITSLLEKYFNNVQCHVYPRYVLTIAEGKKL